VRWISRAGFGNPAAFLELGKHSPRLAATEPASCAVLDAENDIAVVAAVEPTLELHKELLAGWCQSCKCGRVEHPIVKHQLPGIGKRAFFLF
jgi:hypothetical protein